MDENRLGSNQVKIIAFAGPKGAGKTTFAKVFVSRGAVRTRFADVLKRMLLQLPGITEDHVDGSKKEVPLESYGGRTARDLMVWLGEGLRELCGSDIWVRLWQDVVKNLPNRTIVVDDLRYENEAKAIHELGGVVMEIRRSGTQYNPSQGSERGLPSSCVDLVVNPGEGLSRAQEKAAKLAENLGVCGSKPEPPPKPPSPPRVKVFKTR